MRKHLFTLFVLSALLLIPNIGKANTVTVDNWNGSDARNTTYLPIAINTGTAANCAYHSVYQQLYYASELSTASSTSITAITFYYTSGTSFTRKLKVWLKDTNLENFATPGNTSTPNMVSPGTKVFAGDVELTAGSPYTITFDTPYSWDGTSNIIVTVFDSTGIKNNSTNYGASAAQGQTVMFGDAGKVRFLHKTNSTYADFANAGWTMNNLAAATANSSSVDNRKYVNKITFTFGSAPEPPATPSDLSVNAAITSATLSWSGVVGATSYDLQQSANGSDWSTLSFGETGTSYNWTGLSAASTQYARIRANNAVGSSGWSDAVTVTTDAEHIHDGISFNKWASTTSLPTSGNYYINENMNFEAYSTDVITLTGNLNLCLNGKTVNMESARIVVPSGMTLAIYDNVGGGKITSFVASEVGAADIYARALIAVYSDGELELHQGTIENSYIPDKDGSSYAIYSNGTLHLSGDVLINSNDADIYLYSTNVITLDGAISNAEKHKVYKLGGDITYGWSTYMSGEDPRDYFESANSARAVFLDDDEAALRILLRLSENSNNSSIGTNKDQVIDVALTRSLTSSQYNTFCLPFNLNNAQLEAIFGEGYDLEEFDHSELVGDALELTFVKRTSLTEGAPYLIKPSVDVVNPYFEGVTIYSGEPGSDEFDANIYFYSTFAPTVLASSKSILFLGANNELFWPESEGSIKAFRAYFVLQGAAASGAAKRARIVKKEDAATGIQNTEHRTQTQKVLRNGEIYILRDGKTYNVLGIECK